MFFWGSYNFSAPQLTESPNRPPLRYPVYVPPAPSMVAGGSAESDIEERLRRVEKHHIVVKAVACGQKHLVALVRVAKHCGASTTPAGCGASSSEAFPAATVSPSSPPPRADGEDASWILYGMGSNHNFQLGHHVPEYTTTLTRLCVEELLSAGTSICSLACGNKHTLFSTTNGDVFAAGDNSYSQLGVTAKVHGFAPVGGLAHVKVVSAAGNASFAIDANGHLYSWGEAQHGHLCHGDNGERLDQRTLQTVQVNVTTAKRVEWFVRHHVIILEVAVGRSHVVCRSEDEVYTCGDGLYGKLGSGNFSSSFVPLRVNFPERTHPERLCGIAAGDDHTFILRESPVIGAVVYYFGKMSNGDGLSTPIIVQAPASTTRIGAGRGTFCTAVTREGQLYVWGKHGYAKVSNGTPADATRSKFQLVAALEPFNVTNAVCGGTFVVATAERRLDAVKDERRGTKEEGEEEEAWPAANDGSKNNIDRWDIVIPQDDRVGARSPREADASYEKAVHVFLSQYLGSALALKYVANIPAAPPLTDHNANAFVRIGASGLTVGQKVRLWMTDVYALGTVAMVQTPCSSGAAATLQTYNSSGTHADNTNEDYTTTTTKQQGYRVLIKWQRDDWHDEEVSLHSDDETLNEQNPNRWQPLWFLHHHSSAGEYSLGV